MNRTAGNTRPCNNLAIKRLLETAHARSYITVDIRSCSCWYCCCVVGSRHIVEVVSGGGTVIIPVTSMMLTYVSEEQNHKFYSSNTVLLMFPKQVVQSMRLSWLHSIMSLKGISFFRECYGLQGERDRLGVWRDCVLGRKIP